MNKSATNTSFLFLKNLLPILFVCASLSAFSQPDCPPGNPDGDPACNGQDPSIPIDGGATLFIAAGVGLIGRKALQYRKSKTAVNE